MTKLKLPQNQQFCFCHDGVSLQMVSGGAAKEGYLGRVTLKIDGEYVDYVKAQQSNEQVEPVAYEIRAFNATQALIKRADVAQEKADVLERGFGGEADVTIVPLYTTSPQRPSRSDIKPLTEDERFQLRCQWNPEIHGAMHDYLIQQTEAAHGIKE